MIARITGILLEKKPPFLIIDVGGIGYEISAPMNTFFHLPNINEKITLYTHLIIREDAHTLFGFHSEADRSLFRALIKVNGVGPTLAITILSGIQPQEFIQYVNSQDAARLTAVPGIGKKTAERLIMEMKDALSKWDTTVDSSILSSNQQENDAIDALVALGYKSKEAQKAINRVKNPDLSSEELIRHALKQMT